MMNEKDMSESNLKATTGLGISILLVVDTAKIIKYFNDNPTIARPSTNPAAPTSLPLTLTQESQRLICDSPRGIVSGQATYALNFRANANDIVSFAGTSIEANSDSAVIVYGLVRRSGDNVFNDFTQIWVKRTHAVMPQQGTGVPPISKEIIFATYESKVSQPGIEYFDLKFALYTLDTETSQTQNLYGYFLWDPAITVS